EGPRRATERAAVGQARGRLYFTCSLQADHSLPLAAGDSGLRPGSTLMAASTRCHRAGSSSSATTTSFALRATVSVAFIDAIHSFALGPWTENNPGGGPCLSRFLRSGSYRSGWWGCGEVRRGQCGTGAGVTRER